MNKTNDNIILLLQSGGRDSALAGIRLLSEGKKVYAVTFLRNSSEGIDLPESRAKEIFRYSNNYSWAAIDYANWESRMKEYVQGKIEEDLPRSCLICAMSRLTAAIRICNTISAKKIAVGYTGYQNDWVEQTPLAIELQKQYLEKKDIELIIPTSDIYFKSKAIEELKKIGLTERSLENPCCVALEGTQFVPDYLVKKAIELCITFDSLENPNIIIRSTIGDEIYVSK